jgi:gag-polypeptide of LTR copia-type
MSPALTYDMLTSSNSGNTVHVPKLRDNGSNWVDYKSKVENALGAKGVIRHIEGTAVMYKPYEQESGVYVTSPGVVATDEQIEAREKKIDEYNQREYMAKHILLSSVSQRVASLIRDRSAAGMWKTIMDDATDKSDIHITQVKRKLHEAKCEGNPGTVRSHLNNLTELHDELLGMGQAVDDFTSIIINSMPPSYHNLISAVNGSARSGGGFLSADDLMVILTEEDDYRKGQKKSKGDNMALSAAKGKTAKKPVCDNCNREGHTGPNCYQSGGGKEGQAPWQQPGWKGKPKDKTLTKSANNAMGSSKPLDNKGGGASYAFSAHTMSKTPFSVTVDSGATSHFCPDRSKFITYTLIAGEEVIAADKRVMEAKGVGDIAITLPNRDSETEVILREVYHVPAMASTLISIGRIDVSNYSAHFGQGMC